MPRIKVIISTALTNEVLEQFEIHGDVKRPHELDTLMAAAVRDWISTRFEVPEE